MIAVITGFQAALAGASVSNCPYSVVHQLPQVEQWIEGFLDCRIAYDLRPGAFESAFEEVVAAQIESIPYTQGAADLARPEIAGLGYPGSQDRIEALRMFYEEQVIDQDENGNPIYSEAAISAFA